MTKYLITYHSQDLPNELAQMDQAKADVWQWLNSAGGAIIDRGAPVRMVGQVGGTQSAQVIGYTIIEAVSKDDVVKLLQTHPFVLAGGTLQINEVIPYDV